MPQTAIEKIVQSHAVGLPAGHVVRAGDYVTIRPRHVMTHDNTAAVLGKFRSIGAARVRNPQQPVFTLDHDIQNRSDANLAKYERIESFAREQGVDFWPAGSGIGHQIMCQEGYVVPDSMVVASDSHSNIYGALAALGTPVVRTDAAAIWATGETWWQVPESARVVLQGRLRKGVRGKDVIIALIGTFQSGEALNRTLEFDGEGLASLSMDQRLTIANMTTEWGALAGRFPFDEVLEKWLLEQAARHQCFSADDVREWRARAIQSDPDADHRLTLKLDLGHVVPHVAGPDEVQAITPLPALAERRIPVHKAYLLSCVNSRLEDILDAAQVVRGKTLADGVELYLAAASREVQQEAERLGAWGDLVRAGARVLPPGCGPCIGLGEGTLEPGQRAISATNRNFKGRMGSRDAQAYLASPAVVAASACAGYITGPDPFADEPLLVSSQSHGSVPREAASVDFLEGFPRSIEGRLLYVPKDNMNTDGIYGKEFTYRDDMTPDEMAAAAMQNYDPDFQSIARAGDILVGGNNFGTGSSREQAATALAHRGIRMVVAGSFSQTYMRNAFNNGFITLPCPELLELLRAELESGKLDASAATLALEGEARVDFAAGRLTWRGREFPIPPLSTVAQELVLAGGAEAVV